MVIGNGAAWIDGFAEMYCPGSVCIVDRYHAVEHLWALGREAYEDKAAEWVEGMKDKRRGGIPPQPAMVRLRSARAPCAGLFDGG